MTITLAGFMGAGKTCTGKALADMLGWDFEDLDARVEHKKGMSVADFIRSEGEEAFRAVEAECLRDALIMQRMTGRNLVLALGGGTPTISSVQHLIFEETTCVWLKASLDTVRDRLGADRSSRPLFSEELFEERLGIYAKAPFCVVTDGRTPEDVAEEVRLLICK